MEGVAAVGLHVVGQCLLGADREDAELLQAGCQDSHRGPVGVEEARPRPDRGDRRLLGPVHQLVEAALIRREAARYRQRPGDVSRVQLVALDPGIEEEEVAAADLPVVSGPMQDGGVGPARGDGVVADVVALDPGAEVEDPLHHPLPLLHGLGQSPDHVLEAADRRLDGPLEHPDLVVVLDQAQLAELRREPALLRRVAGRADHRVDLGVEPAQEQDRPVQPPHVAFQTVQGNALDAEQEGRLRHPAPGAHPELPAPGIGEETGAGAVVAGLEVESGLVAFGPGAEQQHAARFRVPGQPVVIAARPETVLGVIGPHLGCPGRDHQVDSGEEGGERAPPRCVPWSGGVGMVGEGAGRIPVPGHQLDQGGRGAGVVGPRTLAGGGRPLLRNHPVPRMRVGIRAAAGGRGFGPRIPMLHPLQSTPGRPPGRWGEPPPGS